MYIRRIQSTLLGVAFLFALSACSGGTKMLKEPLPQPEQSRLSSARDQGMEATLEWVIVRNGPGTWAARADWDEYLLTIVSQSDEPLTITAFTLVDALGERVEPGVTRARLVRASKKTARRYKNEEIQIQAGLTGYGMFGAGSALFLGGGYLGLGTAFAMSGSTAASIVGPAALAITVAGPVYMAASLVRGYNNSVVDEEIIKRHTLPPFTLDEKSSQSVRVFFPISPAPSRLEISYTDSNGSNTLHVDTVDALKGLHLKTLPNNSKTPESN